MSTAPEPIVCPTCSGYGLVTQPDGSMLTCQACSGKGAWSNSTPSFYVDLPEIVKPQPPSQDRLLHTMRVMWLVISLIGTALSLLWIALIIDQLSGFIWNGHPANLLFGLFGISSMAAVSLWETRQTSLRPLRELAQAATESEGPIPINLFANPRYTRLINEAGRYAQMAHSNQIDETTLLIALLSQPHIEAMITRLEKDSVGLAKDLARYVEIQNAGANSTLFIQPNVRLRLINAAQEAVTHDFPYVDSEDILLAYLQEPGQFKEVFKKHDLTYKEVFAMSRWYAAEQERIRTWQFWKARGRTRPRGYMNRAWTALPTPILDRYSRDLTVWAANGSLAPAATRTKEIDRILEILGRTRKNSVLLIGEPGVGKRTIIGGIAQRIIEEDVPEIMRDKRLVTLEASALLTAGETPEGAMQMVLNEIGRAGNVILVIPDVGLLANTSGSNLDAASLLSNAVEQGYVQVITTATMVDFHRYVEGNTHLTSLFDFVEVNEPSREQAIAILEEEAPVIEYKQHVYLTYQAIEKSVDLSKQYLPDRSHPESAISLLDEAASAVNQGGGSWVRATDIEAAMEKHIQMPIRKANDEEAEKFLHIEETLHQRIIGQNAAITAVASALKRSRAGLRDPKRPIGSFLFVGPTGVGKTETAKAVAEIIFGSEAYSIRLDMSEYQDKEAVSRLLGAAAGTGTYTEGSEFTQSVREHPFSLVLLDEIEKASPDVLNLFLQVLEDGQLTENTGRTVNFKNTLIIATSNAGAADIANLDGQDSTRVVDILKDHFRMEFLNRFDGIVPFHRLNDKELTEITRLLLQGLTDRLAKQEYTVTFDQTAIDRIAKEGADPVFGARSLRRFVQDYVEGKIAEAILSKELQPGGTLQVTADMLK